MLTNWQYYKDITLTNAGSRLSDYQVNIDVYHSTFPGCKQDFSDIRFTDQSGNLIPYWFRNDMGMHRPTPLDGRTVTAVGDCRQVTTIPDPFGGNTPVAYFDGSGDYLTVSGSGFDIGISDFTIEARICPTEITGDNVILSVGTDANNFMQFMQDGANLRFVTYLSGSQQIQVMTSNSPLVINNWHDVKVIRSAGVITLYINGVAGATVSSIAAVSNYTGIRIGCNYDSTSKIFAGYMSELRVSTVARSPVPSTTPFIPDSSTKLLLHFDNYIVPTTFLDDSAGKYECWVRVPVIPVTQSKIRVYWGNQNALSESNGDAVFDLFDNFEGGSWNTAKWTYTSDIPSISGSVLTKARTASGGYFSSIKSYRFPKRALRARIKSLHFNSTSYVESLTLSDQYIIFSPCNTNTDRNGKIMLSNGTPTYVTISGMSANAFAIVDIKVADTFVKTVVNTNEVNTTISIPAHSPTISLAAGAESASISLDWISVRHYTGTEPTYAIASTPVSNVNTQPSPNAPYNSGRKS